MPRTLRTTHRIGSALTLAALCLGLGACVEEVTYEEPTEPSALDVNSAPVTVEPGTCASTPSSTR